MSEGIPDAGMVAIVAVSVTFFMVPFSLLLVSRICTFRSAKINTTIDDDPSEAPGKGSLFDPVDDSIYDAAIARHAASQGPVEAPDFDRPRRYNSSGAKNTEDAAGGSAALPAASPRKMAHMAARPPQPVEAMQRVRSPRLTAVIDTSELPIAPTCAVVWATVPAPPLPLTHGAPPSVISMAAEAANDGRAAWVGRVVASRPVSSVGASLPALSTAGAPRADQHALPSAAYHGPQPPGARTHPADLTRSAAMRARGEWAAHTRASTAAPPLANGSGQAVGARAGDVRGGDDSHAMYRCANAMGHTPGSMGEEEWHVLVRAGGQANEAELIEHADAELRDEVDTALARLDGLSPLLQAALEALAYAPRGDAIRHVATSLRSLAQGEGGRRTAAPRGVPQGTLPIVEGPVAAAAARALLNSLRQVLAAPLRHELADVVATAVRDELLHPIKDGPGGAGRCAEAVADRLAR